MMPNTFRLFLGIVGDAAKSGQFLAWLGDEAQSPVPAVPVPLPGPIPPVPPIPPAPLPVPPLGPKKFTVTATVFGGPGDGQDSVAYADVQPGWPGRLGVALPYHFVGTRPRVHVWGPKGDCINDVVDVGPWNTNDPYWQASGHPQAETGTDTRGRKTNSAGIDLTPATAALVGVDGKGQVSWAFETAPPAPTAEPPWLTLARVEIGFHETGANHGIQKYIDLAGFGADGDPWCAIFAGAMLRKAGVPIPGVTAMARSFTASPGFVQIAAPQLGCIVVFWRGSKGGTEGHVGFWISEDATYIQTLGGNEGDQVEIAPMPKAGAVMGLLGYLMPKT
jgi:uncharacterized protein (TIGR02594 family)